MTEQGGGEPVMLSSGRTGMTACNYMCDELWGIDTTRGSSFQLELAQRAGDCAAMPGDAERRRARGMAPPSLLRPWIAHSSGPTSKGVWSALVKVACGSYPEWTPLQLLAVRASTGTSTPVSLRKAGTERGRSTVPTYPVPGQVSAHCASPVNWRQPDSHTNNRQAGQSTQETRLRVAFSPCRALFLYFIFFFIFIF